MRIKRKLESVWRSVLTNDNLFCVLVDRLIPKFTWAALIEVSELPRIKYAMKLGGSY